jgi:hypothetical protein
LQERKRRSMTFGDERLVLMIEDPRRGERDLIIPSPLETNAPL